MKSKFDLKTHEILAMARVKMLENIYDCHDTKNTRFDCPSRRKEFIRRTENEN